MRGLDRWNDNIHYHRVILDALPVGAQSAQDVGCGEGMLARRLRDVVPQVTAIDLEPGARYRRHTLWRYSLTWTKPHRS